MPSLNNNTIREDVVFKRRVKDVRLRHGGTGGLVKVLIDFNAREAVAARQQRQTTSTDSGSSCTDVGLSHAQLLLFLQDYGVELTPFEAAYLCRAFDDHGSGFISGETFTRHLTGLNERRLRAVKKAWQSLEKRNGAGGNVSRELLLSTFAAVAAGRAYAAAGDLGSPADGAAHDMVAMTSFSPPVGGALQSTFGGADGVREHLKEAYMTSMMDRRSGFMAKTNAAAGGADGESGEAADRVSYAEYLAFYAGVSPQFATDEAFVTHVLQSWAADDATRPALDETAREWGPDGDPLALDGPRYVKDALNLELGVSSKSYNYSHLQREHPYVEPLPPLNRPDIMATTMQQTYVPFDKAEQMLADPLVTRRGQSK
ncbi:protein of unknown function - conserved [Leishmania donovani]|uniref:Hypothetical_protein_conserved n=1 Tax=Leishmania donovani TaxID=5661 RepID=A0A504XZN8_LEIDO|nr:hypothetical protein CGC20_30475 [Leishmania donovani]CAJ1987558.1 protein of unknown function - conserved [Leishmania donovani]VDZ43447.1 hypothetical_protein_conserved [Leishmania donovani]